MDRITSAYVESFRQEQALPDGDLSVNFEHFVNYCIVADNYDDEFGLLDVHTGGGADLTLDGIAIIVNGVLVTEVQEVEDLLSTNGFLDVRFMFMQAKTTSGFSGEQISAFGEGVLEFFDEEPALPMSDDIVAARELMTCIYKNSTHFNQGRPRCELFFVSTGKWMDDEHLTGKMRRAENRLADSNLFGQVTFRSMGAAEIQASWVRSKNATSVEFTFANKATLPDIEGVSESYVGVLPLGEFLKIIADPETDSIRKHIFEDNVRDFQGDNPVNNEMAESLGTASGADRFAVLNNGVTLVARNLKSTANKFVASDYQIVNGCQTSHVLYNSRADLPDSLGVPFKVIATNDDEVINAITTATNRQTQVTDEDLFALSAFQKQLEAFMASFEERHRLHYERRSRQYSTQNVEKVRIINKTLELRSFAAMFLDEPRRAAYYYSELKPLVGSAIFNSEHKVEPYYTAAFAYYKLEYLFRNGQIPVRYKPARYHLLTAARHISAGSAVPALFSNQMERYAKKINEVLWNDAKSLELFEKACGAVDAALNGADLTRDSVKVQSFTEAVISAARS